MLLYRGDKVRFGCDVVHHVLLGGLLARFGDGGTSDLLRRPGGVVEFVLAHVGWRDNTEEERFARHSPMLSFTADRRVAERYMVSLQDIAFETCALRRSHFLLFTLEADWDALPRTPFVGVRRLVYYRSHVNCRAHVAASEGMEGVIDAVLLQGLDDTVRTEDSGPHHVGLIDVVEFLEHHRDEFFTRFPSTASNLYPTALSRARRDKEWLLYPADPLHDYPGALSALFYPNEHLRVEGFRRAG